MYRSSHRLCSNTSYTLYHILYIASTIYYIPYRTLTRNRHSHTSPAVYRRSLQVISQQEAKRNRSLARNEVPRAWKITEFRNVPQSTLRTLFDLRHLLKLLRQLRVRVEASDFCQPVSLQSIDFRPQAWGSPGPVSTLFFVQRSVLFCRSAGGFALPHTLCHKLSTIYCLHHRLYAIYSIPYTLYHSRSIT